MAAYNRTGRVAKKFETYAFIDDDEAVGGVRTRYFLIPSNMEKTGDAEHNQDFDSLKVGDHMRFLAIEHPKGMRAIGARRTRVADGGGGN